MQGVVCEDVPKLLLNSDHRRKKAIFDGGKKSEPPKRTFTEPLIMSSSNETIYRRYERLVAALDAPAPSSSSSETGQEERMAAWASLESDLESARFISASDEMVDIPTKFIPFLSMPYFVGKALGKDVNLDSRLHSLMQARKSFSRFLVRCQGFELLREEEVQLMDAFDDEVLHIERERVV